MKLIVVVVVVVVVQEEPVIKQVTWWDDGEYLQYAHDIENADESSNRKERYKIWVTASTIYGEGKASAAVIFKTAGKYQKKFNQHHRFLKQLHVGN